MIPFSKVSPLSTSVLSFRGSDGEVYGTRFVRTSIVGAINIYNEFTAGFAFKGHMNSDLFEGWLECFFAPFLRNPEKAVLSIADEYGFNVIFLPKYSPGLNPIEKFWANIKIG